MKLFNGLGINVFSHGAYVDPRDNSGDTKRPPLDIPFYPDLFPLAKATPKEALDPKLFEWADVVVYMGSVEWIEDNWAAMKAAKNRVIWRSIGQSTPRIEQRLTALAAQGLELVRYSPEERKLPNFAGETALCRFYKDPDEFGDWRGTTARVISIGQMVKHRNAYCGLGWYEESTNGLNRMMIGPHNDDIDTMPTALLSYDELKDALRENRAFFYTGTFPAPYTLGFIEAFVTGIPVVAIGPGLRNHYVGGGGVTGLYEIPSLIQNGVNGYWSEDTATLKGYVRDLLNDPDLAQRIGQAGRTTAIKEFGKEAVAEAWRGVLLK